MVFLVILILAAAAYPLDTLSLPNSFTDSAIIEANDFNENDSVSQTYTKRLTDSIETKFIRFTDLTNGDTTLKKLNVDTIRSNPNIDSISGNPYINRITTLRINTDSIRSNPDVDSIRGNPRIDSVDVGFINPDSIRGAPNMDSATFTSLAGSAGAIVNVNAAGRLGLNTGLTDAGAADTFHHHAGLWESDNGAQAVYVNAIGNMGFRATPLTWNSAYVALQLGGNNSIFGEETKGADKSMYLAQNAFYSSAWKYISTDEASYYAQTGGGHIFKTAASGTADSEPTWIDAMTIGSDGSTTVNTLNGHAGYIIKVDANGKLGLASNDGLNDSTIGDTLHHHACLYEADNGAKAVYVDNAGNIGLKASAPKSWNATYVAMQIGGNSAIAGDITQGASKALYLCQNTYYSTPTADWRHISEDQASLYYQANGGHVFKTAVSDTGDSSVTWTTAMEIDSTGLVDIAKENIDSIKACSYANIDTLTGMKYAQFETYAPGGRPGTPAVGMMIVVDGTKDSLLCYLGAAWVIVAQEP